MARLFCDPQPTGKVKFKITSDDYTTYCGLCSVYRNNVMVISECWQIGLTTPEQVVFTGLDPKIQGAILDDIKARINCKNPNEEPISLPSEWDDFNLNSTTYWHHFTTRFVLETPQNEREARNFGCLYITYCGHQADVPKGYVVRSNVEWPLVEADLKNLIIF